MNKEKLFYKTLQDIFIGAKVEGQGGFINLMKIKSKYYEKIEELLKKDIEEALKRYPTFRDELFDKLYSFFSRYFTESGAIYFKSTPFHNNVYEKIYTDDRDVVLFWKTRMLYYVKTDRIFRSMPVEFDDLKFYFDASSIENKKNNEKRSLIYKLKEIKEDKTIVFEVNYKEGNGTTKTDEILKEIKKKIKNIKEEDLERAFRIFEKQSEVDFFINKNAKAFLQEQFKLWSYQYFWEGGKQWSPDRVNQLQILKDIAFKIIDFVSQFEDELVKIWNKPKFVKNSNYVITLDRLEKFGEKGIGVIRKLLTHKNIKEQIEEWKELAIVDDNFSVEDVIKEDHLSDKYKFLPVDTKYFKDLELEILNLFDDLDNALDGWLIKSENYQALNTLLPKFKEKVQTIYIDPPFNLESSDQFLYRTNYKDSTWATLLENRLRLAKDWLNEKGSIFVRCDYNGNWIVRCVMDEIFGKENFRNEIVVNRQIQGALNIQFGEITSTYIGYDNLYWFSKIPEARFKPFQKMADKLGESYWHIFWKPTERPKLRYELLGILPPRGQWLWNKERAYRAVENYKKYLEIAKETGETLEEYWIRTGRKLEFIKREGNSNSPSSVKYWIPPREKITISSNWTDIPGYSFGWHFPTENSEILLKRVIESTSNENDLVMDFFLGSGTTTAVAHKLKRKWIGIEMGEHFYTVILPRMKKVLAYDKSGISKEKDVKEKYNEKNAGGFFKYYELEQYEETLANTVYENHDMFIVGDKTPYQQYVFMKDEKMLRALEIDYGNRKVKADLNKLYPNIDIAETISNLTGKWIKKIEKDQVEFEDGSKVNIKDLDYKLIKPLIWWE
ncbi:MAG: site-specific DNA-methyltransferase [Sulfurihydrogenibium sp.]|jgi:adenine specific DNA methylase Mod|nr:site-specific DNA-methyltransferase [Sulfurihydrogenibium sp.]